METVEWSMKLRHLVDCRGLLCVDCAYCVLPTALDRHLKDFHHLPRAVRRLYVKKANGLNLATVHNVIFPKPGTAPISGLPVYEGYACGAADCDHLCITAKRMQAHWREAHRDVHRPQATEQVPCSRARLQTLFRGNNLRYFIVSKPRSDADTLNSASSNRAKLETSKWAPLPKKTFPGTNSETLAEWLLTKQFAESSCVSMLPCAATSKLAWRNRMVQACSENIYLRYAVLSVTASHIAVEHADSRRLYSREARKYYALAIRSLPADVADISHNNFFELFNFTRLMTQCCLASVQLHRLESHNFSAGLGSILPEWIPVQHRGVALVWRQRGEGRICKAMLGPVQRLYEVGFMPRILSSNPHEKWLEELATKLKSLPIGTVDVDCSEALDILRPVWAIPYRDDILSFRDVALMWAVRSPVRYFDLLEQHDPIALIIFAYFCVLFDSSESIYWYMKGHAEVMLLKVVQRLKWDWQEWIEWPVGMVLRSDLS